MQKVTLFTDGSVHAQLKIGYGAFLLLEKEGLTLEKLRSTIQVKRFEETSSTKLELQTLIWALNEISPSVQKIIVYTDSQNIIGLPGRRNRLEQNDFRSSKGTLLHNHELYKVFYQIMDKRNCELIKIKGHVPSKERDHNGQIFSLVDKASRQALRDAINTIS